MGDNIRVELTWSEVLIAANVGVMRNVQSLKRNYTPGNGAGLDDTWTMNIEGAAGEMAVAKHYGRYWSGNVGQIFAADVGDLQIKTNCSRKWDDLIVRKTNPDGVYILVLSFLPVFVICGWTNSHEAKQEQWWREGTPGRGPAWFFPRSGLRSLSELNLQDGT